MTRLPPRLASLLPVSLLAAGVLVGPIAAPGAETREARPLPDLSTPPGAKLLEGPSPTVLSARSDSVIAAMVARVSADTLHDFLEQLTGEVPVVIDGTPVTMLSRHGQSNGAEHAALFLEDVFARYGYTVEQHYYNFPYTLRSLAVEADGSGVCVGTEGRVLRTADGTIWARAFSGLEAVDGALQDVDRVAVNDWVLVGNFGVIATSADAGATWTLRPSSATVRLNGVDVLPDGTGWAAGKDGILLRTTDGGATWADQSSGTVSFLYDVAALDSDTAVVVGDGGLVLRTSDGGQNWSPVSSGTTSRLYRTAFVGSTGWAVGQGGVILRTADGGLSWSAQVSGTASDLQAVSFSDASHGWAVGAASVVLRTSDGGSVWTAQTAPSPGLSLLGVAAVSADEGVLVGLGGELARTTNQGAAWTDEAENLRTGRSNVVATRAGTTLPDEEVLLVGHYDTTSNEPDPGVLAPGADDNGSGIAAIVESARIMAGIPFERTVRFVCFSEEELGFLGSEAYVARAVSRGENIVAAFNLDSVGWNDDYFRIFSRTHSAWLGTLADQMAATHVPWLPTYHWDCSTCGWSDQITFWNQGFDAIVGIETWDPAPPQHHTAGDTLGLVDLALVGDVTRIAASTIATAAAVDTTAGVSVVESGPFAGSGSLIRLDPPRPNPTGGGTTLHFSMPARGDAKAGVYDVAGRRIRLLHDGPLDAGSHELVWDGRGPTGERMAAGIYFVRIESRGLRAARRLVLLR